MTQYDRRGAEGFDVELRPSGTSLVLGAAVGAAAGAIAGAVAGAAVARMFQIGIRSGDEPPIRVRHGSIHIQAADKHKSRKFDKIGNPKKWKIVGMPNPLRGKDSYLVCVLPSDHEKIVVTTGDDVRVDYSDGQRVAFKSTGNKTTITADQDLSQASDREIAYHTAGHITKVIVDGTEVYVNTTGTSDDKLQIVLLDC